MREEVVGRAPGVFSLWERVCACKEAGLREELVEFERAMRGLFGVFRLVTGRWLGFKWSYVLTR